MEYKSPTGIIKRVGIYMGMTMPTEKSKIVSHLQGLEACRFDLAKEVVEWHQKVVEMKNRMLHPKDKDLTELDRTTMVEAHIAFIKKDYELLVKLEEIIKDRIELGKAFLQLDK